MLIGVAIFLLRDWVVDKKFGISGAGGSMASSSARVVDGVPESLIFGIQIGAGVANDSGLPGPHPIAARGRGRTQGARAMSASKIEHPSLKERRAAGKEARGQAALTSHAGWKPASDRADPVVLLEEQDAMREPDLVPVRHGRMMVSPFTFYRGAAKIMAADLKHTPRAGLIAQLCGDAHLSNFGAFASPERTLLFDVNDFDETLPGPFEYDVQRLSASVTIAARNNGFTMAEAREATMGSVASYREAMAEFAKIGTMDTWYTRLSEKELMSAIKKVARSQTDKAQTKEAKKGKKRAKKTARKAETRDSLQALRSSPSASAATIGSFLSRRS